MIRALLGRNQNSCILAAFGLTAVMAITPPAPAQFGEAAGFGDIMQPYYLGRDLNLFERVLGLDEGQSAILESLYWDYEDQHEASKARMVESFGSLAEEVQGREDDKAFVLQRVLEPFEQKSEEWDRLKREFVENVQAILNQQQLDQWPTFERELRREKELGKGRFSGESANLFLVLRRMDLDQDTQELAEPMMQEYGMVLDQALQSRERLFDDTRLIMMHSLDNISDRTLETYQRQIQTRVAVREVNDQYIDLIAAALPEEVGEEFRQTALEEAYGRVYRETPAERIFQEAKKLEGISEETRAAIISLESAFLSEHEALNARIVQLTRQYEPRDAMQRANAFAKRNTGEAVEHEPDPTRDLYRDRDRLGREYIEQLKALLTPEQFASLRGAQRFVTRGETEDGPSSFNIAGPDEGDDAERRRREKMKGMPRRSPDAIGSGGSGGGGNRGGGN